MSKETTYLQTQRHLTESEREDIQLAHAYRFSLPSKPSQSSFRVLALLFFESDTAIGNTTTATGNAIQAIPQLPPWVAQRTSDGKRSFVVGTNDEPGYMGGAICAERAAMVQLRFLRTFTITRIVISTDSVDPISPGMLCREFLAGHGKNVSWDVPVLSAGCPHATLSARDEPSSQDNVQDNQNDFGRGNGNGKNNNNESVTTTDASHEEVPILRTTIRELYPFPSPYTRLSATESVSLGETYCNNANHHAEKQFLKSQRKDDVDVNDDKTTTEQHLLGLAIAEAKQNVSNLHPIQFGAAAILHDGKIVTTHQSSALEYGCTLDAVSQMASHFFQKRRGGGEAEKRISNTTGTGTGTARPRLIVQADQYGIAHAPFAPARAFLSERGFGDCMILLHDTALCDDDDVFNIDKWRLRTVPVIDLAPTAPSWTEGTNREVQL